MPGHRTGIRLYTLILERMLRNELRNSVAWTFLPDDHAPGGCSTSKDPEQRADDHHSPRRRRPASQRGLDEVSMEPAWRSILFQSSPDPFRMPGPYPLFFRPLLRGPLVRRALKPGGRFGLVCFRPEGGSGYTDQQVYERASLGGGLGYTEDRLRALWDAAPFSLRELRHMRKAASPDPVYGEDFLWALLAVKEGRGL
jgi:hypothetical protein